MSEASDSTFWLIVVAIVAFVVCRCVSYWCDCQVNKAREQTQAAYWKTQAHSLRVMVSSSVMMHVTVSLLIRLNSI